MTRKYRGADVSRPVSRPKTRRKGKDTRPAPITWQTARCTATATGWLFVMPIPMSTNRTHRRGRRGNGAARHQYTPAQHRVDKEMAPLVFGQCAALTGDVAVRIGWVRHRRAGDVDNRTKATLDILKGVAFGDDAQVADQRIVRFDHEDTMAPGVYVWVDPWVPCRLADLERAA